MKIVKRDGKHYLVGTAAEVGNALTKRAMASKPIDLGWSLSRQADEASAIVGDKYRCDGCSYEGIDADFVSGECPRCRNKQASKA